MGALLVRGWFPPHFLPLFTTALRFGERPTEKMNKLQERGRFRPPWLALIQVSGFKSGTLQKKQANQLELPQGHKVKDETSKIITVSISGFNRFNPTFQTLLWSKPIIWQEIWIHFPSVTLSQTTCVTLDKSLKFVGFYHPPPKKIKVGMGILLAYRQKAGSHAPFGPWSIAL